ncbi:centrosomal protein of 83 kDa-like isoform X1 [Pecten maximus]|uniref:centrosomal protein of 83 kDa-like isoform X1 n=1 Tax=Pecten maximus TaxID=6579 RepID=UPI0014591037|nr:centrosomal protein of 83 kDa-like isoform X1 [Pecten maximus]XP_033746477.1 centrosomal protein of 83 kDa-like isoform X1 [Pecten maximus]
MMASSSFLGASGGTGLNASLPPLPPSPGQGLAQKLPQIATETELQKMLTDERMRSQMHRTNYEQLKQEHRRLQDEYSKLEDEIKHTIEESKIVQEKYKTMYEQARNDLTCKSEQLEELRSKVVTPQRLEILKMQVVDDMEKTYKEKYHRQETELDEYKTTCTKLKYEIAFVKSEFEHDKLENQRILEEIQLQQEAEVSNLRKEREVTLTKMKTEGSLDSERVRVLQRENAQLHLKLKSLTREMEEIQAQREKQNFDVDHLNRVQAKQISEFTASIKSTETERESLRKQVEQLQRDLSSTGDTHNKLISRTHEVERENILLKNKADEVSHKSKVDLTNLKMDMLKQRGDLERDRDRLANLIDDLQTKLEISKHTIDQQSRGLAEKERESVRRVQGAREEEFEKFTKLESEKLAMETKLQEIERRKIDEEAQKHAEREKTEERIRAAMDLKDIAERELLVIKTKLTHSQSTSDQLERERRENSELKSKLNKVETELNTYMGNEHEMTDENIRLRNQVELLKEEVKLTKDQLHRIQDNHDLIVAQQKTAFTDDRTQLELRVHELEDKLGTAQKKYQKACSVYKKYKKRSQHVVENTRDRLQLMEAKNEELQLEKKALESCVPQDTYNKLKKQWKDLQRRHGEFRRFLLSTGGLQQVAIGDMSFGSVNLAMDTTLIPNVSFTEQERKHQEDLRLLKQRLDIVDSNQQHQLEELQEIAHSTFKGSLPGMDDEGPPTVRDGNIKDNITVTGEDDIDDYEDDYDDSDSIEKADTEKSS